MVEKYTQNLRRAELKHALDVAAGNKPADLLIKGGTVLDLINGEMCRADVAIADQTIAGIGHGYEGLKVVDATGLTIVPGFIDAHVHLESSLMTPFEFERATLPLGTTTVIADSHEITNVMGVEGFEWFLRCSKLMQQNLFLQVPSCVPSLPGFETNGAEFTLDDMFAYLDHPRVLGLGEMMNYPGVISGEKSVLDKLEAFDGKMKDGHAPLLRGKDLNAYRVSGIENCHESVTADEAKEKLAIGMAIMLREGSVAKNLLELAPIVKEFNSTQCLLCTDDRNPYEIAKEGHINYLIRQLIEKRSMPVHVAYRLSSFSAAKHFGLKRLGLVAPGYQANLVLLSDPEKVKIEDVFVKGVSLKDIDLESSGKLIKSEPPLQNTIKRNPIKIEDFDYPKKPSIYHVIEIVPQEIITNHLKVHYDGTSFSEEGVQFIAVFERYGGQSPPALGFVKGFNLADDCAIASSVAHDSHNLIVVGSSPKAMTLAINSLIKMRGGFVVVKDDQVIASLPLPIGGLLSLESSEYLTERLTDLKEAQKAIGTSLHEPFLQMAFLALPVIPSLKITDQGLIDVMRMQRLTLEAA
ncbi:MAG: adenine deaminase [Alphaproteobacteria bacterium]|nr:adenine deaminase [Alphaproteobacteria bacterium]